MKFPNSDFWNHLSGQMVLVHFYLFIYFKKCDSQISPNQNKWAKNSAIISTEQLLPWFKDGGSRNGGPEVLQRTESVPSSTTFSSLMLVFLLLVQKFYIFWSWRTTQSAHKGAAATLKTLQGFLNLKSCCCFLKGKNAWVCCHGYRSCTSLTSLP